MYRSIVVGTDGSDTANIAVRRATELAQLAGATLHVVHVYQPLGKAHVGTAALSNGPTISVKQVNDEIAAHAREISDQAGATAEGAGVKVESHTRAGDPADALVDAATELGADLLVVGNRGMSGVRRFVLGSVPNKVSHHCPCSLLIVDTSAPEEATRSPE